MEKVGVFSSVYNCYFAPENAVYSYYYRTHIPKENAYFCFEFDSFITECDPRFYTYYYEGEDDRKYAKPWYKFNEIGFLNSENIITLLDYDYVREELKIKAIVKFKDTKKLEEFRRLESKGAQAKFLRSNSAMGYHYLENVEIDVSNERIKQLDYKSTREYNIIKQEINNTDFFVIV